MCTGSLGSSSTFMALGFIAFSIGGEFKFSYFKRVGATPIIIAIFESYIAVALVLAGLLAIGQPLPFSLVLSAIAAATAPAATIMPSASSALFSNRLLVQAGPKPRLFLV